MKMCELSPLEIEKWYAVAVGEIGIAPIDFYDMTEEELLWAYKGHRQNQEDLANIILLAIKRSQSPYKDELFKFIDDSYAIGSLKERNETFISLGIKEVYNNGNV